MSTSPTDATPAEVEGILFREYFVGRFSVWGNGPKYAMPGQIRAPWRLAHARIRLGTTRLVAETINSKGEPSLLHQTEGGSWSYHEIESAQIFESPRWARLAGLSYEEFPVGVRLHFGESRTALLVFTGQLDRLLGELKHHRVKVERTPIKLSPMLIGRR
jgi:hypothetical protein